jgi:hypothetical protein
MNKIIWEKWTDPFGENFDEMKWNNYDDSDLDEEIGTLDEEYLKHKFNNKPVKAIASPMGLIPYNEYTASSKIFNFWVGHTNFNITKAVSNIIEKCEGIEILDIFTRYRFRIGIGKCFKDNEVMSSVNEKINQFFDEEQIG